MDIRPLHILELTAEGRGMGLSGSSTLDDAYAALITKAQTGRDYTCPQCAGNGTINPPEDAEGDPTRCPLCTGYGRTLVAMRIKIVPGQYEAIPLAPDPEP